MDQCPLCSFDRGNSRVNKMMRTRSEGREPERFVARWPGPREQPGTVKTDYELTIVRWIIVCFGLWWVIGRLHELRFTLTSPLTHVPYYSCACGSLKIGKLLHCRYWYLSIHHSYENVVCSGDVQQSNCWWIARPCRCSWWVGRWRLLWALCE